MKQLAVKLFLWCVLVIRQAQQLGATRWDVWNDAGCGDNCLACLYDLNTCAVCNPGYGFDDQGQCRACFSPDCKECSNNYLICSVCASIAESPQAAGLDSEGNCKPCADQQCGDCSDDFEICVACGNGAPGLALGFGQNSSCESCLDPYCSDCSQDIDNCSACVFGFARNASGFCTTCTDGNGLECLDCDTTGRCTSCAAGFGLDEDSGNCLPCSAELSCLECRFSYQQCSACKAGFGLDADTGACVACTVNNCADCSSDYTRCEQCSSGYGKSSAGQCQSCDVAGCTDCSEDFESCNQCPPFSSLYSGDCVSCELKTVCSSLTDTDPFNGPTIVSWSPDCSDSNLLLVPAIVNTSTGWLSVCAYCAPWAPTPLAFSSGFSELASLVLAEYVANHSTELCPGGLEPTANVTSALSFCGEVQNSAGVSNNTYDVRFVASISCGQVSATSPQQMELADSSVPQVPGTSAGGEVTGDVLYLRGVVHNWGLGNHESLTILNITELLDF